MIRAEHLTVCYAHTPALSDLTFSLHAGERCALLGANGAGKSTLLLTLAGVLLPASGSVTIAGLPLTKANLPAIRRRVGFVFQNPDDQLFMPTVEDDLRFGPRNFGVDAAATTRRIHEVAEQLSLAPLLRRPVYQLSGGEKRLAALAGVLVMEGSVLLLDEPCAFLDARSRRRLFAALAPLPHTMLIATHDLDLARTLCPLSLILQDGRLAACAQTSTLLDDLPLMEKYGM